MRFKGISAERLRASKPADRRFPIILGLSALLFWLIVPGAVSAQRLPTRVFTELDGLPSSDVHDVLQTEDGRLWFATRTGLMSYDGAGWSSVEARKSLPFSATLSIQSDRRGRLWVLGAKRSVLISVREDDRWRVTLAVENQAIPLTYQPVDFAVEDARQPKILLLSSNGEVGIWQGEWRPIELPDSSKILAVDARDDTFWMAGNGLWRIDGQDRISHWGLPPEAPGPILGFTRIDDRLWLVGRSWIGWAHEPSEGRERVDIQDLQPMPRPWHSKPAGTRLAGDGQGGVIVVGPSGILHRTDAGVRPLGLAAGLGSRTATSALLDREGQVWITSKQGVTKIRSFLTNAWDRGAGLFDDEVTAIAELPDGTIVLGHQGGLTWWRNGRLSVEDLRAPADQSFRIMDMEAVAPQTLWIAALPGYLICRTEGQKTEWIDLGDPRSPRSHVSSLARHPQTGDLWIASNGGVGRLVDREIQWQTSSPQNIRRLEFGPNGRLYAATHRHGMWILEPRGKWTRLEDSANDGSPLSLYTVFPTEDAVWVGGSEGLYRIEGHRLIPIRNLDMRRPVFALLKDTGGALWMGTDNGTYRLYDGKTRHFGTAAGLLGRESNRAALMQDRRGAMWIGTPLGATRFHLEDQRQRPPPQVEISRVQVAARTLPADLPVTLDHNDNSVAFDLRRLTLYDSERSDWSVRLAGLEEHFEPLKGWNSEVRYAHLPAGEYQLEVKARWQGQDWGEITQSAPLTISRPWWASWKLHVALASAAVALVWLMAWAASSARHSRLLARQVDERTTELKALNQRLQNEIAEHRRTETELRVASSAAEQASRAKSSFLATMSHEIRTPMNGILGIARLLERETDLSSRQRERVKTLRKSGQALLEILDDILDYSKIEAGRLEIQRHRFELPVLLKEVVSLFASRAEEKGLELTLECRPDLPQWVLGDGSRIRQVLINLVGNAIKFTERGSVTVQACRRPKSKKNVVLRVADTGIGIEEELQWQLFQPFHQLESGHHRRHGGTGLGLAISHHLVTAMDGFLRVESQSGRGATFSIELPLPAVEAAPSDRNTKLEARPEPAPGIRILVAEDNPINQLIVVDMLAELGYEDVTVVENGLEALAAVDEASFDLILMDLQMPELDGLETSRRLNEKLGSRRPRLVALTAHALEGTKDACFEAGMDDYLAKPFSFEDLAQKLEPVE